MRMSDVLLFGPPLLMGLIGWTIVLLAERSNRTYREQLSRGGPAE